MSSSHKPPHDHLISRRELLGGAAGVVAFLSGGGASAAAGLAGGERGWERIAGEFLLEPGLSYLNTGSAGPSPRHVMDTLTASAIKLEREPTGMAYDIVLRDAENVRRRMASFIGANSDELTLTTNTTSGMQMVAQGIKYRAGDRILTTNQEAPGIRHMWNYIARRHDVHIDVVTLPVELHDTDQILARFKEALTSSTRAISISHVNYANGFRMPVERLSTLARQHGCLLIVDGAQAAGAMAVDVTALGCDAYAFSGHKWLLGPKGTGALYIRKNAAAQIAPIQLADGYAAYTASSGLQSLPNMIALGAALEWAGNIGWAQLHRRCTDLHGLLYAQLKGIPAITIASPAPGHPAASPMIGFRIIDAAKRDKITALLAQKRIIVKRVDDHAGVDIRVGCHVCNNEAHIDRFISTLRQAFAA